MSRCSLSELTLNFVNHVLSVCLSLMNIKRKIEHTVCSTFVVARALEREKLENGC